MGFLPGGINKCTRKHPIPLLSYVLIKLAINDNSKNVDTSDQHQKQLLTEKIPY